MMARRAKGEGSYYEDHRRGGWVGEATIGKNPVTGKRRRVVVRGKTKGEVKERLKERIKEHSKTGPATFGELLDGWVRRGMPAKKKKSDRTKDTLEYLISGHIRPVFDDVAVSDIDVELIEDFLEAKANDGLAKATLMKVRGVMSQCFDDAVARRHTDWNPAKLAVLPETKPERTGRALTRPEVNALLNVTEDLSEYRNGAWVHVALSMGLRPGEVSGLEWSRVDLDQNLVVISKSMGWNVGRPDLKETKTGEIRTIEIPDRTAHLLRVHKRLQAEERLLAGDGLGWPLRWQDLVFVSEVGTPLDPSHVRKFVRSAASEAGIEGTVNAYTLRHTAASLMAAEGVPPLLLSQLLGHKDPRVLSRFYVHPVSPTISVASDWWQQASE